jgi:hypothetical protein
MSTLQHANREGKAGSYTPHIQAINAGKHDNLWDPVHNSIFEVTFKLPQAVQDAGFDSTYLTLLQEHVTEVGGLDALQKTPAAGQQKFMGVDVSYLNPYLDSTYADITITFNLNLRNNTDNYILKLFKAWATICYDIHGHVARGLKADYTCEQISIAVANRDGSVWKNVDFKDVFVTAITGLDSLSYGNNDAATLQVTFRADYWDETLY